MGPVPPDVIWRLTDRLSRRIKFYVKIPVSASLQVTPHKTSKKSVENTQKVRYNEYSASLGALSDCPFALP